MSAKLRCVGVACLLIASLAVRGSEAESEGQETGSEMTTVQLVLLFRGPNQKPMGEREIQLHQEAHLDYLDGLLEQGRVVIEGPLDGGDDLRSIVVLNVPTTTEAERLMREDPWVRIGRLRAEVHPWSIPDGVLRKPTGHVYNSRCNLALLERSPNAPAYTDEQLAGIRAGHKATIQRISDSGHLLLAGPMTDDGSLREALILRAGDTGPVTEQLADDPAVKLGRLQAKILPWHVLDGTLPDRSARE